MTLSNLINSNTKEIIIKILSTNGIDNDNDNNTAIVKDTQTYYQRNREKLLQYYHERYLENKEEILQKKREHNKLPEVKKHSSDYHKKYYLDHKEEMNRKHREYSKNRNRKNKK